ncbi:MULTISPECIES: sulfatase [Gimesia]|uniref:sulfatase family protein n=1 Tax=Gimesia TaxID=1649453 RepID=UPI00118C61F6|nr:sulfatase [Gimesia maris]QDU17742.1 Arylsulfatase [Gimesia maris]
MNRCLFGILSLLLLFVSVESVSAAAKQKNVIVIVVDDQGFQAGCYGNKVIKTPGIDMLAESGTRFSRAHCTTASCSASRSVILTGLYNHATGHYGHAHSYNHFSTYATVKSLPIILEEAGYRTCSIGKYHVAPEYVYQFQEYRNKGVQGNRNSAVMAANAKEFITEDDDRPFFLYYCSNDPHRGGGPDGYANFNDNPDRYPGVTPVKYKPEQIQVPPWLPDHQEVKEELAEYYQAISRLDQGVVSLINTLKETGHWEDTLVMFLSDNGPPFPGAKTNLYQPGMNLPLIVRDPTVKNQGIVTDALVTWADLTPTILDYCDVTPKKVPKLQTVVNNGKRVEGKGKPVPYTFHGRSFLEILGKEHAPEFDESYASHTFHEITMYYPMRVILSGNYKYIFNIAHELPYPFASDLYRSPTWQGVLKRGDKMYGQRTVYSYLHRPRHELYDIKADPWEAKNLAFEPEHQETLTKMQEKLKAWQEKTKDPWVLKWEYE